MTYAKAFWWDEDGGQVIGPIFTAAPDGKRMHLLYLRCLDAAYTEDQCYSKRRWMPR
jgi:hypothetical protein